MKREVVIIAEEPAMSSPVVFAAPAEIELGPNPVNPDWIIDGTPQARAKCLAESADGTSSVMAWSCTPGRFEWYYAVDETVHIISWRGFRHRRERQDSPARAGGHGLFPGRQPQRLAGDEGSAQTCRVPPQHAAAVGFVLRAWNKVVHRLTGFPTGSGLGEGAALAPKAQGSQPPRAERQVRRH